MKYADFSIPTITKKFDKFNVAFFEGKLTRPTTFKITLSEHTLGRCAVKMPVNCYGIKGTPQTTISLSSYYNVSEEEMETTLIHEMIHLYQYQVLKEAMNHKDSFRRLSAKIAKMSEDKYVISRLSKRDSHLLSHEAEIKKQRRDNNRSLPIIIICKQTNQFGEEYGWFIRTSEKLYNAIFKQGMNNISTLEVLGFVYEKPSDWLIKTTVCRTSLKGKKMPWREFKTRFNEAISAMTKGYKHNSKLTYKF